MTTTRTAPTAERRGTDRPRNGRNGAAARAPWLLLAPFLALFALTFVLPILAAIGSSFTKVTRSGLFGEAGVTSGFAGFSNYALALGDGAFIASIGRMLLFGVVQVPVMIVLCTFLALLLESASARWPGFFRAAYFLPYGVPGVIATILWSFLYVPGLSPPVRCRKARWHNPGFPRCQQRPVVHRKHRHLELHRVQHADHRGPIEGDPR